ncbi:MAG: hypothetical protein MJ204_06755 [Bacteroidales bacterium]|nr:hypothetical protein [Bacteroidales bacterium]
MDSLNNVKRSFSLPMQILVCIVFFVEVFVLGILLYLRKDFTFDLHSATSVWGLIVLAVSLIMFGWNIASYFHRNRLISKAVDQDSKLQIFKASVYSRYITLLLVAVVGIIFNFVSKNLYYLVFFAMSFVWQIAMFPTRTKITMAVGVEEEKEPVAEEQESVEKVPTDTEQANN